MAFKETVYMSGGEVRTITVLDKMTPYYWAMENSGLLSPARPSDRWPEAEEVAANCEPARAVPFEAGRSSTASAAEALGLGVEFTNQEMVDHYVRLAQQARAEAFREGFRLARTGVSKLFAAIRGWVHGFTVDPSDLARPPFSR